MPSSPVPREARHLGRRPSLGANLPRSLKTVMALYMLAGLAGLALTLYSVVREEWTVSPLLAGLPIGIGLVRLKEGWRVCAIVVSGLVLVVAVTYLVILVS